MSAFHIVYIIGFNRCVGLLRNKLCLRSHDQHQKWHHLISLAGNNSANCCQPALACSMNITGNGMHLELVEGRLGGPIVGSRFPYNANHTLRASIAEARASRKGSAKERRSPQKDVQIAQ